MQTFLPEPDFSISAMRLDRQRLGKQRVEAKQIYLALTDSSYGWQNHPAVKMWRGYEAALAEYGFCICLEWRNREYADSLLPWFRERLRDEDDTPRPPWIGDEAFHDSHRSNLLRKLPEHYRQFWPELRSDLPYIWPAEVPHA